MSCKIICNSAKMKTVSIASVLEKKKKKIFLWKFWRVCEDFFSGLRKTEKHICPQTFCVLSYCLWGSRIKSCLYIQLFLPGIGLDSSYSPLNQVQWLPHFYPFCLVPCDSSSDSEEGFLFGNGTTLVLTAVEVPQRAVWTQTRAGAVFLSSTGCSGAGRGPSCPCFARRSCGSTHVPGRAGHPAFPPAACLVRR